MNDIYIVSTGLEVLAYRSSRWYDVENIIGVFDNEDSAFECLRATSEIHTLPRNWPIGKKVYIYPKTYVVMRAYEVKGE
jgi:hypothetical protein